MIFRIERVDSGHFLLAFRGFDPSVHSVFGVSIRSVRRIFCKRGLCLFSGTGFAQDMRFGGFYLLISDLFGVVRRGL